MRKDLKLPNPMEKHTRPSGIKLCELFVFYPDTAQLFFRSLSLSPSFLHPSSLFLPLASPQHTPLQRIKSRSSYTHVRYWEKLVELVDISVVLKIRHDGGGSGLQSVQGVCALVPSRLFHSSRSHTILRETLPLQLPLQCINLLSAR